MEAALTAPTAAAPLDRALPAWVDRGLYPFSPRRFDTPDGAIRYLDEGSGPAILLVHGTPSWSFEWRAQVADLARTHRVIAPDHLGFGLSDKPARADLLRPADHARRLLALVDALDLRDLTLVVHDFGGPIGLPVALDRPARVRAVLAVNTWAWAHGHDPKIGRMSRLVASRFGRWLYLALNASPRFIVPMAFGRRERLTARVHAHYLGPFAARADRLATWVCGVELAASDPYYESLWARREALRGKLSLAWGTADPAFDGRYLARWRAAFPEAPVDAIEGAGHFPQEEEPARVTEAIRAAARRETGRGG
ncbi:MAG: alpha/beta fold hydrolase [Polyangiales bacterium]